MKTSRTLILSAAFVAAIVIVPSAVAAPRLQTPVHAAVGHGFQVRGTGFAANSTVTLMIGRPNAGTMPVARVRTNRAGAFRRVERIQVTGPWVWIARGGGSARPVRRSMRVSAGPLRLTLRPAALRRGNPLTITGSGWRRASMVQLQVQGPRGGAWRNLGRTRVASGRFTFTVPAGHPRFGPSAQTGDWMVRACTNGCRLGNVSTRAVYGNLQVR